MKRPWKHAVVVASAAALAMTLVACGGSRSGHPSLIPQPPLTGLNSRTRRRLAPASDRVDLVAPSFSSDSVEITNPLFPVRYLRSGILVGRLDWVPWRAETTLLPHAETISWNGMRV